MNLVMKCGTVVANLPIDTFEKTDDVIFAYRKNSPDALTADEFVGMFDLGTMDYLYITEPKAAPKNIV